VEVCVFLSRIELDIRNLRFTTSYAPGQINWDDPGIEQKGNLAVTGVAELAGPLDEIRVRGHITGAIETVCDRCLEKAVTPLDGGFDLLYRPVDAAPESEETAIAGDETDVGFYEGDGIELADAVREQVLLWLPMSRLCRPDCRGICPVCGGNRNSAACNCRAAAADERWSALRDLKKN
jgi:uncharacterized protein